MILLEYLGIGTYLHLGMYKTNNTTKIPHAWLEVKLTGDLITSKIRECQPIMKI